MPPDFVKLTSEERHALDEILESNGWEEHQLLEPGPELESLQMFLSNYNRVSCLHLFPSLKRLQVIGQSVEVIEGLDTCIKLESLWIVEGDLTRISGLDAVTCLTKLYLYGNCISQISSLDHLQQLRVLWLADNLISDLTGLAMLTALEELNVARNPIRSVPHCIRQNCSLRTLNLAGTEIPSFTAISALAALLSVRELFLDDPNWGRAPIADLANYQTMVIVQLPQLTVLDYLLISKDASDLAQSTFAKKRMFYNMRTKSFMRVMHEAEEVARNGLWAQQHAWHAQIEEAVRVRVRLEYMLRHQHQSQGHEQDSGQPQPDCDSLSPSIELDVDQATAKLKLLKALERSVASQCSNLQAEFNIVRDELQRRTHSHVCAVMLELQSAGNIRIEEATDDCIWRATCSELLHSRFDEDAAEAAFGCRQLKVTRVARIHNRPLKLRFDAAVEGEEYSTEYMFWTAGIDRSDWDTAAIAQQGLPRRSQLSRDTAHEGVVLANRLLLADAGRLCGERSHLQDSQPDSITAKRRRSKILVCRVAFVEGMDMAEEQLPVSTMDAVLLCKENQSDWQGPPVMQSAYREAQAVRRSFTVNRMALPLAETCHLAKALYIVFDDRLVLPEYVVEYELVPGDKACSRARTDDDTSAQTHGSAEAGLHMKMPEVSHILRDLSPFLAFADAASGDHKNPALRPLPEAICTQASAALAHGPEVSLNRPRHYIINEAALSIACGSLGGTATAADFSGGCLKRCDGIAPLTRLTALSMAFNEILSLTGLSVLQRITLLDVSHNHISSLRGLDRLSALTFLDASHNAVTEPDDMNLLRRHNSRLRCLDLRMCPVTAVKTYQALAIRRLPALISLDGCSVSHRDRHVANTNGASLPVSTLQAACTFPDIMAASSRSPHVPCQPHTQSFSPVPSEKNASLGHENEDPPLSAAVGAVLQGMHLRRLEGLSSLTGLLSVSLADNELASIDGLAELSSLTSVDVSVSFPKHSCLKSVHQLLLNCGDRFERPLQGSVCITSCCVHGRLCVKAW
eukprot:jgi/Ulvmu1/9226/UM005_0326.1